MSEVGFERRIKRLETKVRRLELKMAERKKSTDTIKRGWLTTEEAAAYLGITKENLWRLTSKKLLPFYKPNGKFLFFDAEDLDAWIRRNRQEAVQESNAQGASHEKRVGGESVVNMP